MNCQGGAVLIWEDTLEEGNLVLEMLSLAGEGMEGTCVDGLMWDAVSPETSGRGL